MPDSMHRGLLVSLKDFLRPQVVFTTQPREELHDGSLAGVFKGTPGKIFGLLQQGFGLAHINSVSSNAASLFAFARFGIPSIQNATESKRT